MDRKLRAWWFHKQGLDGSLMGRSPHDVLAQTGWSRSVGGANPYLALFARGGFDRATIDKAVESVSIQELPSARGCTYVLPERDFGVGLAVGQGFGDVATIATAVKYLGVTEGEIEVLGEKVCSVLTAGPMHPREIKSVLGESVRNLGQEGKNRGMTTTLPMALGLLQSHGRVRRIPSNGRIDNQRYKYTLWESSEVPSREEACKRLAELYFAWIGPASLKNFQTFSGLGLAASREATQHLGLEPIEAGSDLLILPSETGAFDAFEIPSKPAYAFVGSLDNLCHLRLGLAKMLDDEDAAVMVPGEKELLNATGLSELHSHGIYDRGRLVGVWDFDPEANEVVWATWIEKDAELCTTKDRMETFVREELGDARTFSLDSPESRKPRLEMLRAL